jgi:hypothetical protein
LEKPQILKVLEDAQRAHQAGDFVNALKFYEHFFDHALDEDPYACYGIRLSHCLTGWTELAQVFPGAQARLNSKKQEMLELYFESRDSERYHDYLAISRCLGLESDALEQFLAIHNTDPESAAKLSKYVWNDLIMAEQWQVCGELMPEPPLKMDELFSVFDEANKLRDLDPAFNTIKFERHIVDTLLGDLQNVVMVLRYADRTEELEALQHQFHLGVDKREHSYLSKQVHAKGTFLFSGH